MRQVSAAQQIITTDWPNAYSDWPNGYSEFSKSEPVTSSSCRLYNNHVKHTQGHG